ncbi:hypothetical protein [Actinoplanes aureus]|uniref:Uncharacterized protein n=1 Tax=Actinoplanes aureus TaxID=2792083 RepID=A0A931CHN6_9ACTN|nr:hypothetical protein [Actinoplanes aureus]MBG0568202.1 hypothetical protein [Actinoplanes aureus]
MFRNLFNSQDLSASDKNQYSGGGYRVYSAPINSFDRTHVWRFDRPGAACAVIRRD